MSETTTSNRPDTDRPRNPGRLRIITSPTAPGFRIELDLFGRTFGCGTFSAYTPTQNPANGENDD